SCTRSFPSRAVSASSLALTKARCAWVISGAAGLRAAIHVFAASRSSARKSSESRRPPSSQRVAISASRVFAYPLEGDPQRLPELRQWSRKSRPAVKADELQTPELFRDVVIGNRLEDNRQEPL